MMQLQAGRAAAARRTTAHQPAVRSMQACSPQQDCRGITTAAARRSFEATTRCCWPGPMMRGSHSQCAVAVPASGGYKGCGCVEAEAWRLSHPRVVPEPAECNKTAAAALTAVGARRDAGCCMWAARVTEAERVSSGCDASPGTLTPAASPPRFLSGRLTQSRYCLCVKKKLSLCA